MSHILHQFEVERLIPLHVQGIDISYTNASLFMTLAVLCALFLLWVLARKQDIIPKTPQSMAEALFKFLQTTARDAIGEHYESYLPFIFSVFMMVFMGNLLGLFPYSFTFTSQLAPVGAFAVFGLCVSMCVGLKQRGFGWFRTFLPKGIPVFLAPLVVPIEIISFLAKPFSLTVRLVMNMIVGHILIKIVAGFVYASGLAGVFPLLIIGVLILFELLIAFLQAYIFTILTSIYLGEAIHSH